MNKVSPKSLLHSKWTKVEVVKKEKHFVITDIEFDEHQVVTLCIIQAVMSKNTYSIDWRTLKDTALWKIGWK